MVARAALRSREPPTPAIVTHDDVARRSDDELSDGAVIGFGTLNRADLRDTNALLEEQA